MKLFIIFLLLLSTLQAHPHTFIEVHPSIKVKDGEFKSIHFKWVLDDMTSTILIMDLDKDGDRVINKQENFFIFMEYFSIFKDYDYYTHIKIDDKKVEFPEIQNFKATIENNRICYSFDIEENYNIKNTILEFGDSDFYVAMVLKKEFLSVDGAKGIVTGVDNDFYFGYKLELK